MPNHFLMKELESRIVSEFSVENALNIVKHITGFGERICGTREEQEASRWVASQLEGLGLEVSMEPFKVVSWRCRRGELRVVRPEEFEVGCSVVGYSPSTSEDGIRGELVFVRDGLDRDYAGLDVRGKVVLALWNDLYWAAHPYWVAAKRGASAFIIAYTSPGILRTEAFGLNGRPLPIPALTITWEDYERIKALMERGPVTVEVFVDAELNPSGTSYNVVGKLPGKERPDRYVVACGHVDSWFYGANDDACAVAAVLEMARVLTQYRHRRSLIFLVTGSEEAGSLNWFYYLQGSNAYVKAHSAELHTIVGLFNGELLGKGEKFHVEATPELVPFLKRNAEDLGILARLGGRAVVRCPPCDEQDAYTFAVEGVPSCCVSWTPYEEYHSPSDTVDIIEPDKLATSVRMLGLSVYRMANAVVLPYDFTHYARTLLEGNMDKGMAEVASPGTGVRTAKGLRELQELASGMVSLDGVISKAERFLELSGRLSKRLEAVREEEAEDLNDILRRVSTVLNSGLIGAWGHYGFSEMFLPGLRAIDDMVQISRAVEALRKVYGSFVDCMLKSSIEVLGRKVLYVDVYEELSSLEEKLELLKTRVAHEALSVAEALRDANSLIGEALSRLERC